VRSRRGRAVCLLTALALALASPITLRAEDPPSPDGAAAARSERDEGLFTWRWHWDKGLRYDIQVPFDDYWIGPDAGPLERPLEQRLAFVGRIGGRIQVDAAGYASGRGLEPVDAGIEMRRLRFGTRGDVYLITHARYAFDVDFIGTDVEPGDAYLWWDGIPVIQSFRIGNFTPSFSVESVTSTRDIVFMETALPVSAFGPARSAGVELGGPVRNQRLTWSFGLTRTLGTPDEGDRSKGAGRAYGRVTGLLVDDPAATRLLHLGASASLLFAAEGVRYRSRPESHLAPYLVDTGTLQAADQSTSFGLEAVHIRGPWLFMGEAISAAVRGADSANLWGFYALASRSLTGEPQPFNRAEGILARDDPARPFSWTARTWGSLRASARVSYLDLNDGQVRGGRETDLTTDLTWVLNHYLMFKVEGGMAFVRDRPDGGNLYFAQARFQIDFY
jgi:phosphate-selective porin OprO/OprP